jgi:hypothetical protein
MAADMPEWNEMLWPKDFNSSETAKPALSFDRKRTAAFVSKSSSRAFLWNMRSSMALQPCEPVTQVFT